MPASQCRGGPYPTLVLPAGEPVELDLTSIDVIHAFWLPYLRFKMYAYPDHVNSFTTTLDADGALARTLRPAVRAVPLRHELLCPGRLPVEPGHERLTGELPAEQEEAQVGAHDGIDKVMPGAMRRPVPDSTSSGSDDLGQARREEQRQERAGQHQDRGGPGRGGRRSGGRVPAPLTGGGDLF